MPVLAVLNPAMLPESPASFTINHNSAGNLPQRPHPGEPPLRFPSAFKKSSSTTLLSPQHTRAPLKILPQLSPFRFIFIPSFTTSLRRYTHNASLSPLQRLPHARQPPRNHLFNGLRVFRLLAHPRELNSGAMTPT